MSVRRCRAMMLGGLVMLLSAPQAFALIPEPDNKLYGRVFLDGFEVTSSDTHVSIVLKVNGAVIAEYRMGDNVAADDLYVLSVPLDALEPQAPNTARTGDTAMIYGVANGEETFITSVDVGARGAVRELDISTDFDEDGVLDISDAFPLNPLETLDTDGDAIGNNADTDDDGDGAGGRW